MANVNTEFSPASWIDYRRAGGTELAAYESAVWNSVAQLRTALATADAAYYTAARLDGMTKNDMVYALRIINAVGP